MSWKSKRELIMGHCTSPAIFGESMVHIPEGGVAQTFNGIWSEVHLDIESATDMTILSDDPTVGAKISDFDVYPRKGDKIVFEDKTYTIRAPEKDGESGIVLILEREIVR